MRSVPRRLRVLGALPAMAAFWTSRACAPWRRCIFQTKAGRRCPGGTVNLALRGTVSWSMTCAMPQIMINVDRFVHYHGVTVAGIAANNAVILTEGGSEDVHKFVPPRCPRLRLRAGSTCERATAD